MAIYFNCFWYINSLTTLHFLPYSTSSPQPILTSGHTRLKECQPFKDTHSLTGPGRQEQTSTKYINDLACSCFSLMNMSIKMVLNIQCLCSNLELYYRNPALSWSYSDSDSLVNIDNCTSCPTGLDQQEAATLNTHHHVDEKRAAPTWVGVVGPLDLFSRQSDFLEPHLVSDLSPRTRLARDPTRARLTPETTVFI